MSFDPRPDILALFTDSRITASDGKVTTNFVEICISERNPERMADYNGTGLIILEEPIQGEPILMNIGGGLHKVPLSIQASMYIRFKDTLWQPDIFMNNVIDDFQTTIRSSSNSLVSNGYVEGFGPVNPIPTESDDVFGRGMLIYAFKFE